MKQAYFLSLMAIAFTFASCKKEEQISPFTETSYTTLAKFDKNGLPNNLLPKDPISPNMEKFMGDYLRNGKNLIQSNPELFTNDAIADIKITQPSTVYMTYIHQGAGTKNTLAFYTYPSNNPPATAKDIKNITFAFPNVGPTTTLQPGHKVNIGRFNPGTSVGFVLLINAWDNDKREINSNTIHYCTNHILNPEKDPGLRRHSVIINYPEENKVLIGFEDMNREDPNCDHDFNDAVFFCTVVN